MFGVESKELLIILFAVLILFGPKRIPEVARALGKGLGDVRDALSGIERDVRQAADSLTASETRPIPGAGALPVAPPGGQAAGHAFEEGLALYGDRAFLDDDLVTGSVGAPAPPAGTIPTEGASREGVPTDLGAIVSRKPEPGPGPDLAG